MQVRQVSPLLAHCVETGIYSKLNSEMTYDHEHGKKKQEYKRTQLEKKIL